MTSERTRQKLAMRVSAIRFGADLWRLLEAEAALVDVSVSQYVREAALMRATAAITARGEDAVELLASAWPVPRPDTPIARAKLARKSARATHAEAAAVRAEGEQARRRSRQAQAGVQPPGARQPDSR